MAASAAEWAALARAYQRDSRRVAWFAEESLRLYEPPPERIDAVDTVSAHRGGTELDKKVKILQN